MGVRYSVSGNIVDLINNRILQGTVFVANGKIERIEEGSVSDSHFIIPGFIDAHVHIESSMLMPVEFARLAVQHGSVAAVCDPHEIANVLGVDGVRYMIANGKRAAFKFFFGAPSCVPATPFETSGAIIDAEAVEELMACDDIWFLGEMMNFPGVLNRDPEVLRKINAALNNGKVVDGHAPGLLGNDAAQYAAAGITTDHECFTLDEGREKIRQGMKVLIREGSAAKNFNDLVDLLNEGAEHIMFCSDDKHPDDLIKGHINQLVSRAVAKGYNALDALKAASLNPARHYKLDVGMLQVGDAADFAIVKDLSSFEVIATYISGKKVFEYNKTFISSVCVKPLNVFRALQVSDQELKVPVKPGNMKVIHATDGQLITSVKYCKPNVKGGYVESDVEKDVLKIVVVNRYRPQKPAIGFIHGFGLKTGAIASTVAHDSHNIIAIGIDDMQLKLVLDVLLQTKGGIAAVNGSQKVVLPLPIGGLISDRDGFSVAQKYEELNKFVKDMGSELQAPFMTLSFMALLVIPELKLSDKGLFDGIKFSFTDLFEKC